MLRNLYSTVAKGGCCLLHMYLAPGTGKLSIFSRIFGHWQYIIMKIKKGEKEQYFRKDRYAGIVAYQFYKISSN